jgi:hypothetical protein
MDPKEIFIEKIGAVFTYLKKFQQTYLLELIHNSYLFLYYISDQLKKNH